MQALHGRGGVSSRSADRAHRCRCDARRADTWIAHPQAVFKGAGMTAQDALFVPFQQTARGIRFCSSHLDLGFVSLDFPLGTRFRYLSPLSRFSFISIYLLSIYLYLLYLLLLSLYYSYIRIHTYS